MTEHLTYIIEFNGQLVEKVILKNKTNDASSAFRTKGKIFSNYEHLLDVKKIVFIVNTFFTISLEVPKEC